MAYSPEPIHVFFTPRMQNCPFPDSILEVQTIRYAACPSSGFSNLFQCALLDLFHSAAPLGDGAFATKKWCDKAHPHTLRLKSGQSRRRSTRTQKTVLHQDCSSSPAFSCASSQRIPVGSHITWGRHLKFLSHGWEIGKILETRYFPSVFNAKRWK